MSTKHKTPFYNPLSKQNLMMENHQHKNSEPVGMQEPDALSKV